VISILILNNITLIALSVWSQSVSLERSVWLSPDVNNLQKGMSTTDLSNRMYSAHTGERRII